MRVEKEDLPLDPEGYGYSGSQGDRGLPENWKTALAALVSARLEMIRIEAKPASLAAATKALLLVGGMFMLFSAWTLLLIASIGAIAASTSWEWYHVAFAAAGAHFLIAIVFLMILRSRNKVIFPITRAEFDKDREWLNRIIKR